MSKSDDEERQELKSMLLTMLVLGVVGLLLWALLSTYWSQQRGLLEPEARPQSGGFNVRSDLDGQSFV